MDKFVGAIIKGLLKILWSIFVYIAGSVILMFLMLSVVSGKFPPPLKDLMAQFKQAQKNIAELTRLQKQMQTATESIEGQISGKTKTNPATTSSGGLMTLDGISKMKDHNRELEEAYQAAGSQNPNNFEADSPLALEIKRLRFDVDVLKSQLAQARADLDSIKQPAKPPTQPLATGPTLPAPATTQTVRPAASAQPVIAAQPPRQPTAQPIAKPPASGTIFVHK